MDSDQTSHDLLAHLDRPKTLDLPDFEWVEEVIPFNSAARVGHCDDAPERATDGFVEVPLDIRRGVSWVLAWTGALAVIAIAAGVLVEFAYVLAAEHALSVAARAGAMEATLPRATYRSVTATVERRLSRYPLLTKQLHVSLLQNGTLVQSQFRPNEGDRFAITLSAPSCSAIPDWLRALPFWCNDSPIQSHAEQQVPGRKLAFGAGLRTPPR
jgi:hypothetical protein